MEIRQVFQAYGQNAAGTLYPLLTNDTGSLKCDTELEFSGGTLIANINTFSNAAGTTYAGLVDASRQIIVSPSSTVTAVPSGTQDVDIVANSVGLMLNTGGTIAQVTLVPTVTTVGTVSTITGGNITTTSSSTANVVIQTDNVGLIKTTGGTVTPITASGNALIEATALSGGTISNPSGIQEVALVGRRAAIDSGTLHSIVINTDGAMNVTNPETSTDQDTRTEISALTAGYPLFTLLGGFSNQSSQIHRLRTTSAVSGGTLDTGLLATGNLNYNGAAWIDRNVPVINDAQYTTTVTSGTVWTPTGGTKFVMTDLLISTKDATSVSILDGTTKVFEAYLAANGGVVSNFKTPIQSTTADNSLHITTDTASTLSITTTGYEI